MMIQNRAWALFVFGLLIPWMNHAQDTDLEKLLNRLDTATHLDLRADLMNEIAIRHYGDGNLVTATEWLLKENAVFRQSKDTQALIMSLGNLASIHLAMDDYTSALQYAKEAAQINAIRPTYFEPRYALTGNLAAAYEGMGEVDSARLYYEKTLAISEQKPDSQTHATILGNYGNFLVQSGDTSGLGYDRQALEMLNALDRDAGWQTTMTLIAEDFLTVGNTAKALELMKRITEETDYDHYTIAQMYSQVYEQMGEHESALLYLKRYIRQRDSTEENEHSQVQELIHQYSQEKHLAEQERIEIQEDLRQARDQQKKIVSSFFLATILLLLALLTILFYHYRKTQKHSLILAQKNRELQTERQQLEFKALLAQIKPHFVFNVLNSIQQFIAKRDIDSSFEYLGRFGEMMRTVLNHSETPSVCLRDEINALINYVELERLRFDHSLGLFIETGENVNPDEISIPPMLIQPLVENAIWHGIHAKKDNGKILIRLTMNNGVISCEVEDNGIGYNQSVKQKADRKLEDHDPSGLEVTRLRVETMWSHLGEHKSLVIEDLWQRKKQTGTVVRFEVPTDFMEKT